MTALKKGMSLIELMVVIGIIAVLALMAVPALAQIRPYAELRSDSRFVATAMRQARLKAANSHKPVRVVVDCSMRRPEQVCVMQTYMSVFSDGTGGRPLGEFREWTAASAAPHFFAESVGIQNNGKLNPDVDTGEDIFWAVFLPSSRMIGSHAPFQLTLASNRNGAARTVTVDGVTGRVTVDD